MMSSTMKHYQSITLALRACCAQREHRLNRWYRAGRNGLREPTSLSTPSTLEALRIIERPYFPSFEGWRDWGGLENTKYVTLGVIPQKDTTLDLWNPPPNLETLTLLLGIDSEAPDTPIIGFVYAYIKSKRRSGKLVSLRSLTLNLVSVRELGQPIPELDMEALCIWAFPLQQLCSSLGIRFGFQHVGSIPLRLKGYIVLIGYH